MRFRTPSPARSTRRDSWPPRRLWRAAARIVEILLLSKRQHETLRLCSRGAHRGIPRADCRTGHEDHGHDRGRLQASYGQILAELDIVVSTRWRKNRKLVEREEHVKASHEPKSLSRLPGHEQQGARERPTQKNRSGKCRRPAGEME